MYTNSPRTDFFKFFLGFVGMISLGFFALVAIGAYQVEIAGDRNISGTNTNIPK